MRRKRISSILLAGAVCVSLLSGCGSRGEETAADIPQSEALQTEAAEEMCIRDRGNPLSLPPVP